MLSHWLVRSLWRCTELMERCAFHTDVVLPPADGRLPWEYKRAEPVEAYIAKGIEQLETFLAGMSAT